MRAQENYCKGLKLHLKCQKKDQGLIKIAKIDNKVNLKNSKTQ